MIVKKKRLPRKAAAFSAVVWSAAVRREKLSRISMCC